MNPLSETRRRQHWKIVALGLGLLVLAAGAWFYFSGYGRGISREDMVAYGKSLAAGWFLLAFFVLPLTGFPISILLFLAGIRFGLGGGMALAAAGISFHNVAAYLMAHRWFREKLKKRLEKSGYDIPRIDGNRRIWYTALFAAVHGPPYAAKLYLLALTDIPLRIYFWAGVPVYVLFCLIPVGAGSAVMSFDPTWVYVLVTALAGMTFLGHWLKKKRGDVGKSTIDSDSA